jgi:hypothetical protein
MTCFLKKILEDIGAKIFRIVITENWVIKIFCTYSHKIALFETIRDIKIGVWCAVSEAIIIIIIGTIFFSGTFNSERYTRLDKS